MTTLWPRCRLPLAAACFAAAPLSALAVDLKGDLALDTTRIAATFDQSPDTLDYDLTLKGIRVEILCSGWGPDWPVDLGTLLSVGYYPILGGDVAVAGTAAAVAPARGDGHHIGYYFTGHSTWDLPLLLTAKAGLSYTGVNLEALPPVASGYLANWGGNGVGFTEIGWGIAADLPLGPRMNLGLEYERSLVDLGGFDDTGFGMRSYRRQSLLGRFSWWF